MRRISIFISALMLAFCSSNANHPQIGDPNSASYASIDRFQDSFATLFKRSAPLFEPAVTSTFIPGPNQPIALDDFLVEALSATGESITYYSLDIVSPTPQTVYLVVDSNGNTITGQLPIFTAIPGESNYSDFARVTTITVSSDYIANSMFSASDVTSAIAKGAVATQTTQIANWPIVPKGTTAQLKFQGNNITGNIGWFDSQLVSYLTFETNLVAGTAGTVPAVPIIVIFANNTDPAEGFASEADGKTHNVVSILPDQDGYSSFWAHSMGYLSGFDSVHDWPSAEANISAQLPYVVNCPVVSH